MGSIIIDLVRERRKSIKILPRDIENKYLVIAPEYVSDRYIKELVQSTLKINALENIKIKPYRELKNSNKYYYYFIEDILVQVWYKKRKTLLVAPSKHERSIGVIAPSYYLEDEIKEAVNKFIIENPEIHSRPSPSPYLFNYEKYTKVSTFNGENFCYLNGGKYRLLYDAGLPKESYIIDAGKIFVTEKSKVKVQQIIKKIYKDWLTSKIPDMLDNWAIKMNLADRKIKIFYNTEAWGSCAYWSNWINLNPLLGAFPIKCIEETFVHELNHFYVQGHNKTFFTLMDQWWPEWRQWRIGTGCDLYMVQSGTY